MKQIRPCLADLNLRTFGDVADNPLPALDIAVGKWAASLQRWAQGIDSTPVMPPPVQPRLTCSHVLQPDTIDDLVLQSHLPICLNRSAGCYGAIRFLDVARASGIKPILGAELTFHTHRAVLLAKITAGYGNLCRILSARHDDESFNLTAMVARHRPPGHPHR